MYRFSLAVLIMCALCGAAENPMGFREYTQVVTAEFATPDEARRATAEISKLPNAEELAFTCRWDDSNRNNINMSATMKKCGIKGTFFLTSATDKYFKEHGSKLVADGHGIGTHTLRHPNLAALRPEEISAEVMLARPLLESKLNTPVNSFVLPGCVYRDGVDTRIPGQIRDAVIRSGFFGTPESWSNVNKTYECKDPRQFVNTCYFKANDRNPTEELFFNNLAAAVANTKRAGYPPVVTLGTHAWQNKQGFEVLSRCFNKIRKNNWWFCSFTEYAAYRYEYLFCPVQKGEVDGTKVDFTVRRIVPYELGHNMPLSLLFTVRPTRVMLDGKKMAVDKNDICKLPHNAEFKMPEMIDYVRNPQNVLPAEGVGKSAKFPGLEFAVHYEKKSDRIVCRLSNLVDAELKNIRITLRLPLRWETGIFKAQLNKLDDEFSHTWRFDPGQENMNGDYQYGRSVILAQCDFEMEGKAYRIYADTALQGKTPQVALGKNMVYAGPFAVEKAQPDALVRFSNPGEKLLPFGTELNEKWRYCESPANFHNHAAFVGSRDRNFRNVAQKFCGKDQGIRVTAVDFDLTRTEDLVLEYNYSVSKVFLNGIELTDSQNKMRITARPGKNRLLLVEDHSRSPHQPIALRLLSVQQNAPVYTFSRPEF